MTRIVLTVGTLFLGLTLLISSPTLGTHRPGHKPPKPTPTPPPSFVVNGASIYHKQLSDISLAVQAGLNTVRIVNWLHEGGGGNPYDESRWQTVDNLVNEAKARGLRVLLDLSTYRNLLLANGENPYTKDWQQMLAFVNSRYGTRIDLLALAGEPESPNGGAANRPTATQLTEFYRRTASQWRAMSGVPVESGGLLHYSWNSGIDWRTIFADTRYCSVHVYSQADIDYLPTINTYCDGLGLPLLIEEFGQPQSVGDAARASYFDAMYDRAVALGAGIAFWNLGSEVVSASHDVNSSTQLTWDVVKRKGA